MALTCPTDLSGVTFGFDEFIDCATLTINYDILGQATLSFSVVSRFAQPIDVNAYTNLTFGGVNFRGYITKLDIKRFPGTIVYEHQYSVSGIGCRV
jgi:hypothetical protein